MLPPLTVRNLTAAPLTLKTVEKFYAPAATSTTFTSVLAQATGGFFQQATKSANSKRSATAGADAHALEGQVPYRKEDCDILCDPFRTQHTDVGSCEHTDDVLRLTFTAPAGHQYRVDVTRAPARAKVSATSESATALQMTGVFIDEKSWLALYSIAGLHCWMRNLHDSILLSALSIPGTHNSPTCYRALPSVRCQAVSLREQLDNGVRFFDVRLQPESAHRLVLVHGVFPISLSGVKTFDDDLLPSVYQFLQANPSETLVMSIKREGPGSMTDEILSKILYEQYCNSTENSQYWYTDPRIPTLGQARGRIVIMRRFALHAQVKEAGKREFGEHDGLGEWAIDASHWADNTPYDIQNHLCVQDFYDVLETETIKKKYGYVCAQLTRSGSNTDDILGGNVYKTMLYLNFLTASNFFNPRCWPEHIAAKINPAILQYLAVTHGRELDEGCDVDAGTGIMITDWCGLNGDWALIHSIVGFNARILHKTQALT